MNGKNDNLNDLVVNNVDVLREIASIGCGNAVTSLSSMIGKRVNMSVPVVNLLDFKDVANCLGGPESQILGILVSLSGDLNGIMMFIVRLDVAHTMVNMLMGSQTSTSADFTEIEYSALSEIGNILTSSYLGSLAGLINKKIKQTIPYLSIDMANAILSVPAIEFGKVGDKVLFIESVFKTKEENVSGYFVLVPDMESFHTIFSSLGVL